MSVLDNCNKIQDVILAGTTLITSAPHVDAWPTALADGDLPMVLTRPGPATWEFDMMGSPAVEHRSYFTDVYVMATAAGTYAEGLVDTLDVIQAVGAVLAADGTLGGTVYNTDVRDQGLLIMTYSSVEYRGTRIQTDVVEA